MEKKNMVSDPVTEDFDFGKHFVGAIGGALYYLLLYIPFVLPFLIWGKAATRLSLIWQNKSIVYSENNKVYPVWSFYFFYLVNFILDAAIFLSWPVGFLFLGYQYGVEMEFQPDFVEFFLIPLFGMYVSVISIKLGKETLYFILNNLVLWVLDVLVNIGKFIKNMWLLNFVYRKKE
jgi:hypothetical protein